METKMSESYDFLYKIILIGDSGVGKSNILSRFARDEFYLDSKSTIGVEFASRILQLDDTKIKIQLWDTAGQEKYRAITRSYYRGAVGILLVFDITNQTSFHNTSRWLEEIQEYAQGTEIILLGNKSDLNHLHGVSKDEALDLARKNNCSYFETSALTGKGVEEAFVQLVSQIYQKSCREVEEPVEEIVILEPTEAVKKCSC